MILKGGRTSVGRNAVSSHTGSLAGAYEIWDGLFRQVRAIPVASVEELIDGLLAFQFIPELKGRRIAMIGPGGGASVTATDQAILWGLEVPILARETVKQLQNMGLPPGTSLVNPLDIPAAALSVRGGDALADILNITSAAPNIDAVIIHLNLTPILELAPLDVSSGFVNAMVDRVIDHRTHSGKPVILVIRSTGEPEQENLVNAGRLRVLAAKIPFYRSLPGAVRALSFVWSFNMTRASSCIPTHSARDQVEAND